MSNNSVPIYLVRARRKGHGNGSMFGFKQTGHFGGFISELYYNPDFEIVPHEGSVTVMTVYHTDMLVNQRVAVNLKTKTSSNCLTVFGGDIDNVVHVYDRVGDAIRDLENCYRKENVAMTKNSTSEFEENEGTIVIPYWEVQEAYDRSSRHVGNFLKEEDAKSIAEGKNKNYRSVIKRTFVVHRSLEAANRNSVENIKKAALAKLTDREKEVLGIK